MLLFGIIGKVREFTNIYIRIKMDEVLDYCVYFDEVEINETVIYGGNE